MDILYIFNFESQHMESALVRFRHSLASIAAQGARICVSNNSEDCILSRIDDVVLFPFPNRAFHIYIVCKSCAGLVCFSGVQSC